MTKKQLAESVFGSNLDIVIDLCKLYTKVYPRAKLEFNKPYHYKFMLSCILSGLNEFALGHKASVKVIDDYYDKLTFVLRDNQVFRINGLTGSVIEEII